MPYTITRQSIRDYARWRRAFEENADARKDAGSRGGHIFRNDEDASDVIVFLAWEDLGRAKEYLRSEAVQSESEELEGEPEVLYLEEMGRPNQ